MPAPRSLRRAEVVRRFGRPVLRAARDSTWVRRGAVAVFARTTPLRARFGAPARAADRAADVLGFSAGARRASAEALVEFFFELVDDWDVELFVEAGAKEASAARRAADLSSVQRAVAFEANPFTYRRFAKRLSKTSVEYRHLALDRSSGTASFFVRLTDAGDPSADGQGSLHRRADYDRGHEEVTVPTIALDGFFSDDDRSPIAMWVDVEGATANVFGGAERMLASTHVVLVEVETRPFWDPDQWTVDDVIEHLAGHGLVPVARDAQSTVQYNVLFVRRERRRDDRLTAAARRWRASLSEATRRPADVGRAERRLALD